ncbi:MAG: hypothetical protein KKB70_08490, partial [Proteobacteria bacterium]|nr:hypothetical protein [Pseudomonadota bacterium]
NDEGEKTYVNNCVDDTTKFYSHRFETDTCGGWNYNDEALTATQSSYRYILDDSNSTIVIEDCEDRPDTVTTYAYLELTKQLTQFFYDEGNSATFTVPDDVTTVYYVVVAGGAGGAPPQGTGHGDFGGAGGAGAGGTALGGGGGGAAGEAKTGTMTVTPGQVLTMTVGDSEQNTTFEAVTATWNHGLNPGTAGMGGTWGCQGYVLPIGGHGGRGGTGYGEGVNGQSGSSGVCTRDGNAQPGPGGVGYGAGGGGHAGTNSARDYTRGAPGIVEIRYDVMKYMRPDGTFYYRVP